MMRNSMFWMIMLMLVEQVDHLLPVSSKNITLLCLTQTANDKTIKSNLLGEKYWLSIEKLWQSTCLIDNF